MYYRAGEMRGRILPRFFLAASLRTSDVKDSALTLQIKRQESNEPSYSSSVYEF